jgi:hypothetical protein
MEVGHNTDDGDIPTIYTEEAAECGIGILEAEHAGIGVIDQRFA